MSLKKIFIVLSISVPLLAANPQASSSNVKFNASHHGVFSECKDSVVWCIFVAAAALVAGAILMPYIHLEEPGKKEKARSQSPNNLNHAKAQKHLENCVRWYQLDYSDYEVTWAGQTRILNERKVKKRYRELALKYHPDKFEGLSADGTRKFEKIAFCYEEVFGFK